MAATLFAAPSPAEGGGHFLLLAGAPSPGEGAVRHPAMKREVVIVLDQEKEKLESLKVVDLANQQIAAEGERWIARELLPGTYGVNSEEYFI